MLRKPPGVKNFCLPFNFLIFLFITSLYTPHQPREAYYNCSKR